MLRSCYEKVKHNVTAPLAGVMVAVPSVAAFASETGTVVSASDWEPIIDAITAQISVSTVVGVIASAIGAGIGLVFLWWGGRKAVRTLMSAFRKGKVSI